MNKIYDAKYIGHAFKTARKQLKLNRAQIGKYIGVSKRDVFKYEIGKKIIPEKIITFLFVHGTEKLI